MLHHFNQIQFPSQPTPPSLSPPNPGPSLSVPSQPNPKLRAACDECRLKKLKCTGEQPTCSRCGREGIRCIYSPQKPMGRPKKRQRMEAAEEDGEAFYPQPQQQQEGHLAPLQPVSKPDRIGAAKEDLDFPPFAMEFAQANANTAATATAAAADVTTKTSDWTSWEDFEKFLDTGGAELHPFLSSNHWSTEVPGQDALPGLTPDFATAFPSEGITPPVLNLPPELLLPQQARMGKEISDGGVEWGIGEGDTSREDHLLSDGEPVTAPGGRGGWGDDLNLASALLPSITTTTAQPQTLPNQNPQDQNPPPPPLPVPTCACLSTLYLTLSTLQQQDPHPSSSSAPSFPHTLLPLRTAMQTATSILTCPVCPEKFLSAVQNTQLLGTLLVCIAERFRGVVEGIEAEEGREGKGGEWRGWAKGVVWGEVYGRGRGRRGGGGGGMKGVVGDDGETDEEGEEEGDRALRSSTSTSSSSSSSSCSTFAPSITATTTTEPPPIHFLALTKAMYDRQLAWHSSTKEVVTADGKVQTIPSLPEDFPRDREGNPIGGTSVRREDHMCLKFRGFAEKLVEGLDWS
ncbi:hypothetical protein D0862_06820 [Hortaea werneckii]|uniref:Zn(2)-C6 fungal-type domain-containing protein n=1 Tax=Hortaea werneckii TaxID=91943 RepID=A0A3M7GHS0_HORWE|nr:hypothetical protein D0862_06820 [Hortaea werneckii]